MSTPGTDVFFHCRQSPILFGSREAAGYKQMYKAVQKKKKQSGYASSGLKPWKDDGLPSDIIQNKTTLKAHRNAEVF